MKYLLPAVLSAALVCVGCSQSTDTPADPCSLDHELSLQTGNWWVYETVDINADEVAIAGTSRLDSVVVEGTGMMQGKPAYMLVNYSTADGGITVTADTTWMAVEQGKAYTLALQQNPELCGCFANIWMQVADCRQEHWNTVDTMFYESGQSRRQNDNGEDTIVTMTMRHERYSTGNHIGSRALTIDGRTVTAQEYRTTIGIAQEMIEPTDIEFVGGGRVRTAGGAVRYQLVSGIGIARMVREAYRITDGSRLLEWKPGMQRTLLRWSVK